MENRKLSMVMDFYELTMSQCQFSANRQNQIVSFDLFYRKNPDQGGFCIFAGLEQLIDYVKNLTFDEDDIAYLKSLGTFTDDFLAYLKNFKFKGSIHAIKEGTPVFPGEPLVRVKGSLIETQLLETALLLSVNHQTLIATKAQRVVRAAQGRAVMEFGARRAHNFDAANYGARAAYIGGVHGTATTISGEMFGIPVLGTMAHSFVQSFPSEYDAFAQYARTYPDSCTLLLDTYDTLHSGVENAIRVAKEILIPNGHRLAGVRIDSGDIAYLSKRLRKRLDEEGLTDCKIVASNSLDEYIISSLIAQGACIDSFGVGENLICSKSTPVFGGVYKLSSIEENGVMIPKIKVSENVEKITNPGFKNLYRIYDKESGKAMGDIMTLYDETIDTSKDLTIYHQMDKWKHKTFKADTYTVKDLLEPIFVDGELVYESPSIEEIRKYSKMEKETLWDEIFRFEYPQTYYVDLSEKLMNLKHRMLEEIKK